MKTISKKYMPNFCILAVYLHLDNIRQGIYKQASLKKYCIGKKIGMINTSNTGYVHELLPSHFPPFNAFLHQMYYL